MKKKQLKKSMKGLGTRDDLLVRCVVGRSEIDLRDIITTLNAKFGDGKTLVQWLRDDTSGAYRKMLLTLCGFDPSMSTSRMSLLNQQILLPSSSLSPLAAEEAKKLKEEKEHEEEEEEEEKINKHKQTWDEQWTTSPTV
ncbi:hypothetical protein RFI_09764, partial [Reticulomyxa filosa]